MKSNTNDVENLIAALGFNLVQGQNMIWQKKYSQHANYVIEIDLSNNTMDKGIISWGSAIKTERATTSNFSQRETLVVLECVNRLLEIGYQPDTITLEKSYDIARSGVYLDILVVDKNNTAIPYVMIECKTYGKEFKNELSKMRADGGQLFGYFVQQNNAKFLCLYASKLNSNGLIEYEYEIIETERLRGNSKSELHDSWDKSFFKTGLFEIDSEPYNIQERKLRKSDLEDLKEGDSIFNEFMEILRKNVISDKPNAFNKIFNLFICKVQDEEKSELDELDFQWTAGESNVEVLNRLNDLYKKGMLQYLGLDITDYTEQDIDTQLTAISDSKSKDKIREMLIELRLYKNNEFAFKEVVNQSTFEENCNVIRDVVRLLQRKRIRYANKQQFLGDFFEKLLNTSVKQESGQFFTPIPITRFICDSLPLKYIIDNKIAKKQVNFLPYIIDYASGSGHFLTESMERIDRFVKSIDDKKLQVTQRQNLTAWCNYFNWASEFVYGIEKDYRLAKTTKISCFLNGDGQANIIYADGLDHFGMSSAYKGGRLETKMPTDAKGNQTFENYSKLNQKFDVLVANPPYSIPGFKGTINYGESSFELYNKLTDDSKEIECLFIERARQLLVTGGCAAIVLPVSVLTNDGVYSDTRKLLLRSFNIKAFMEFGSSTFMATNTNTVVLFLERRNDAEIDFIIESIEKIYTSFQDVSILNFKSPLLDFCGSVRGFPNLKSYFAEIDYTLTSNYDWVNDYKDSFNSAVEYKSVIASMDLNAINKEFYNFVVKNEQDKLFFYIITKSQTTLVAKVPKDKKREITFLGYSFSNRRGGEGIKISKDKSGNIKSMLYSESGMDKNKVNYYIQESFQNKLNSTVIPPCLDECISITPLNELFDFSRVNFGAQIFLNKIENEKHHSSIINEVVGTHTDWKLMKLSDLGFIIDSGDSAPQNQEFFELEVDASGNDLRKLFTRVSSLKRAINDVIHDDPNSKLNSRGVFAHKSLKTFKKHTIIFPKSGKAIETNKIAFLGVDCFVANHLATVYHSEVDMRTYLFKFLKFYKTSNLAMRSGYPTIATSDIRKFKIPVPLTTNGDIDLLVLKKWISKL